MYLKVENHYNKLVFVMKNFKIRIFEKVRMKIE